MHDGVLFSVISQELEKGEKEKLSNDVKGKERKKRKWSKPVIVRA